MLGQAPSPPVAVRPHATTPAVASPCLRAVAAEFPFPFPCSVTAATERSHQLRLLSPTRLLRRPVPSPPSSSENSHDNHGTGLSLSSWQQQQGTTLYYLSLFDLADPSPPPRRRHSPETTTIIPVRDHLWTPPPLRVTPSFEWHDNSREAILVSLTSLCCTRRQGTPCFLFVFSDLFPWLPPDHDIITTTRQQFQIWPPRTPYIPLRQQQNTEKSISSHES